MCNRKKKLIKKMHLLANFENKAQIEIISMAQTTLFHWLIRHQEQTALRCSTAMKNDEVK